MRLVVHVSSRRIGAKLLQQRRNVEVEYIGHLHEFNCVQASFASLVLRHEGLWTPDLARQRSLTEVSGLATGCQRHPKLSVLTGKYRFGHWPRNIEPRMGLTQNGFTSVIGSRSEGLRTSPGRPRWRMWSESTGSAASNFLAGRYQLARGRSRRLTTIEALVVRHVIIFGYGPGYTASNHRRITAPHTRTFNHGAAPRLL